jgi:hypothetical protein
MKLEGGDLSIEDVKTILREAAAAIKPEEVGATEGEEATEDYAATAGSLLRSRQQYIEWSAALGLLSEANAPSGGDSLNIAPSARL